MDIIEFELADRRVRERYDALFEACPQALIQQSTYWAEVIQDLGPDEPIFLLAEDDSQQLAGLPLYLYRGSAGNALISVPHPGPLGGIFVHPGLNPAEIDRIYACLLERALAIAQARQCLALTLITNPFQDDFLLYQRHLAPTFVYENFTQYLTLSETVGENGQLLLRDANRRSNLSRNLKQAEAAGFTVKPVETVEELQAFYEVQVQRHLELGVEPLDFRLFENIRRHLEPRHKSLMLLVKHGSDIASGCIYVYHRDVLDVLRLTRSTGFEKQSPNYLNTVWSLAWARQQGIQIYNWQSSTQRDDGVYRYKQQWASREARYYFVSRLLCEPERMQGIGLATLQKDYAGHFLVPYAAFEQGFDQYLYKK